MNEINIIVAILILGLVITGLLEWLLRGVEERSRAFKIFLVGALGWLVAYFTRLIPLQMIQAIILSSLGADLTDIESITAYSLNLSVLIWGPLFAALFEESIRTYVTIKHSPIREDKFRGPLLLGLGWATGEIMLSYIPNVLSLSYAPINYDFLLFLTGVFERLIALTFHVSVSFLVFYTIWEAWPKISMLLAMLFHFLLDISIILWILFYGEAPTDLLPVWYMEITLFLVTLMTVFFTRFYWIPKKDAEIGTMTE